MDDATLHAQVSTWLTSGLTVAEVESRLVERGQTRDDAASLVNAVLGKKVEKLALNERRRTRKLWLAAFALFLFGALTMLIGALGLIRLESGLPAHIGVWAVGAGLVGAGFCAVVQAVL
jgi:hypothetical protein